MMNEENMIRGDNVDYREGDDDEEKIEKIRGVG